MCIRERTSMRERACVRERSGIWERMCQRKLVRQRKRTSQIVMDYSHTDYAKLWREEVEQRKRIENELAELDKWFSIKDLLDKADKQMNCPTCDHTMDHTAVSNPYKPPKKTPVRRELVNITPGELLTTWALMCGVGVCFGCVVGRFYF